jgi:type VI secretion system protein ImpK
MREDVANLVFPVIRYGLDLRARLLRGERPSLPAEQATLKRLLGAPTQSPPWGSDSPGIQQSTAGGRGEFLGIRYALTCWLDEIMVDSPWGHEWNEQKLEQSLYRTNLRFEKFWEQAALAESLPGHDAAEAFFWCVMLGFRGKYGDDPAPLRHWVENARARIAKAQGTSAPAVPEGLMEAAVPVLPWIDRYQQMVRIVVIGLLILVPIAAFLLVQWAG